MKHLGAREMKESDLQLLVALSATVACNDQLCRTSIPVTIQTSTMVDSACLALVPKL